MAFITFPLVNRENIVDLEENYQNLKIISFENLILYNCVKLIFSILFFICIITRFYHFPELMKRSLHTIEYFCRNLINFILQWYSSKFIFLSVEIYCFCALHLYIHCYVSKLRKKNPFIRNFPLTNWRYN